MSARIPEPTVVLFIELLACQSVKILIHYLENFTQCILTVMKNLITFGIEQNGSWVAVFLSLGMLTLWLVSAIGACTMHLPTRC